MTNSSGISTATPVSPAFSRASGGDGLIAHVEHGVKYAAEGVVNAYDGMSPRGKEIVGGGAAVLIGLMVMSMLPKFFHKDFSTGQFAKNAAGGVAKLGLGLAIAAFAFQMLAKGDSWDGALKKVFDETTNVFSSTTGMDPNFDTEKFEARAGAAPQIAESTAPKSVPAAAPPAPSPG